MKRKLIILLIAGCTAGCMLSLTGCSLPTVKQPEMTLSTEMETEELSDGSVRIHSHWYKKDGTRLANATVVFMNGKTEICRAVTDEDGLLDLAILPANESLTCTTTDASGNVLGEATIAFKISGNYQKLAIHPAKEADEEAVITIDVPLSATEINAAMFVTENAHVSAANISTYVAGQESPEVDAEEKKSDDKDAEKGEKKDESKDSKDESKDESKDASKDDAKEE